MSGGVEASVRSHRESAELGRERLHDGLRPRRDHRNARRVFLPRGRADEGVSGNGISGSDAKEICFAIFWREADCEGQSILFK